LLDSSGNRWDLGELSLITPNGEENQNVHSCVIFAFSQVMI